LGTFRAAIRAHDITTLLRLQRQLLTDSDDAERALKDDQSRQADAVRQATVDLRAGVAGENNALDHAEAALRSALAGQSLGRIAPFGVSAPVADGSHSLEQMTEHLRDFRQAIKDRNADAALKLQAKLLADLMVAEASVPKDDSDQGRALRDALADVRKGLDGDGQRLAAAAAALPKLIAPAPRAAAETDVSRQAASLATKIDAFRMAVGTNSRTDLLRLQRDILAEADQDTAPLRTDQSTQAAALRTAIDAVRAGVSGDLSKLDDARADLGKLAGEDVARAGISAKPIANPSRFASDLDGKVASFEDAIEKGDTGGMLRLQHELSDAVDQADVSLKQVQGKPAEEARAAIAAIRTAFAGDVGKLDEARLHLRIVSGAAQPGASASAVVNAAHIDLQPVTQELRNKLIGLRDALGTHQPAEEIAKRREALKEQVAKANEALRGTTDPRADRVRAAVTAAREAAAGDDVKVDAASKLLEQDQ
jgi:hypothetical protein